MSDVQLFIMIAVGAAGTCALRFLPFLVFRHGKRVPGFVEWLGGVLPRAVMAMLVVYCLKDVRFAGSLSEWAPALAGVVCTISMHLWKKNLFLSISAGTAIYMILIRVL